ncbi:MAG: hypothetical protein IV100_24230 [Myxococcales bacterium]|nr:hypothetical protein [Myxococcales bacterium]
MRLVVLLLLSFQVVLPRVGHAASPPWEGSPLLDLVPKDSYVVSFSAPVATIAEKLGLPKLFDRHKALFAEGRAGLVKQVGADLLTVAGWEKLGIDFKRPAAFAYLDANRNQRLAWLAVSDPAALDVAITKNLGADVARRTVGAAIVVAPAFGGVRFILRDGYVGVLTHESDDGVAALDAIADRLANLAAGDALSANEAFKASVPTAGGGHIAIWWDIKALSGLIDQDEAQWKENRETETYADVELREAKNNNAPPDELKRLEDAIAPAHADRDRRFAQEEKAYAFGRRFVTPVEGQLVVMTIGDSAITLQGVARLAPDHVARLLLKPSGTMTLARAMPSAPLGLVEASVDPKVLTQLFKEFVDFTDSRGFEAFQSGMKEALGVELEADVLSLLKGHLGLGFRMGGQSLTTLFAADLVDGAKARAMLDRVVQSPEGKQLLTPAHDGGKQVWQLPWSESPALLQLEGDYVVMSSEAALTDGLAKAGKGAWLSSDSAAAWLLAPGVAAIGASDIGQLFKLFFMSFSGDWKAAPEPLPEGADPKLVKKLDAIRGKKDALEAAKNKENEKLTSDVDAILGTLAVTASPTDAGFVLVGGQSFGTKTVAAAIDGITGILAKRTVAERKHSEALQKLYKEEQTIMEAIYKAAPAP